jgi:hypothetical protein
MIPIIRPIIDGLSGLKLLIRLQFASVPQEDVPTHAFHDDLLKVHHSRLCCPYLPGRLRVRDACHRANR